MRKARSTMQIRIKLFATFRQYLPLDAQAGGYDLDVPAGTRAIEILSQLGVPMDKPEVIVILVNGRHSQADRILEEGDVVSAFPTIGGG
jgi:sulfur carrier protein ThiS